MTDRQHVLRCYPKARAVKCSGGYEIRDYGGDDCYERGYTIRSDGPYTTARKAWKAAAELALMAEPGDKDLA